MRTLRGSIITAALGFVVAATASAQQFRLLVTQAGNTIAVQNNSQLTFNAPVGGNITAQVTATYTGAGSATIANPPLLLGSTAFSSTLSSTSLPVILEPGSSFSFEIRFRPTGAASNSAQLVIGFLEASPGATTLTQGSIQLGLLGTAPSFVLSYLLQTDLNVVPLGAGGTLAFEPTVVNTIAQATLNVSNSGSGAGAVSNISLLSGAAFRLTRIPLFPVVVGPGQILQVGVLYQPTGVGSDQGQLAIAFESGAQITVNLLGSGSSPRFVYEVLDTGAPQIVNIGGSIELPAAQVGQTSSVVIQVTNNGNASGIVSSINIAGAGFQGSLLPVLPQLLPANASLIFTVLFTPPRAGLFTGNLIVNADRFALTGRGLGSQLTFSYEAGGSTITLDAANNSVVFSPVAITQSARVSLKVRNTGTADATLSNIGPAQSDGPFSISAALPLPIRLTPDAEFQIPLVFTPTVVGFANGSLRLDGITVNLVGSGTKPPAMPGYTLSGPTGNVTPGPFNIALNLDSTYPVGIVGSLNLRVASALPPDPAVQFVTGGQTVRFTIPANTRTAIFSGQGPQIGFQTGTVAATLTVSASFATEAGAVELVPPSTADLQLTVPSARPTLLSLQVTGQTASAITITVTGFSTTRSVTAMTVEFKPRPDVQMAVTRFTIDLQQIASIWFRSSASQAFGGQFTLSLPFNFQGTVISAGQSIVTNLESLAVTVSNETGESQQLQAKVLQQ